MFNGVFYVEKRENEAEGIFEEKLTENLPKINNKNHQPTKSRSQQFYKKLHLDKSQENYRKPKTKIQIVRTPREQKADPTLKKQDLDQQLVFLEEQ